MPFLLSGASVVLGIAVNLLFVSKKIIRKVASTPSLWPCGHKALRRVLWCSLLSRRGPAVPPARVICAITRCHLLLSLVSSCPREQPWKVWSGKSVLLAAWRSTPLSKHAPCISLARRLVDAKLTVSLRLTKAIVGKGSFFLLRCFL